MSSPPPPPRTPSPPAIDPLAPNRMGHDFMAICVPLPIDIGSPRLYGMLTTLSTRDTGSVGNLEKLAALSLVDAALADPEKRDELEELIEHDPPHALSALVFGDCARLSLFIMNTIHVEYNPNCYTYICIDPIHTVIMLPIKRFFRSQHAENEPPMEKLLELLPAIFDKPVDLISIWVNNTIPAKDNICTTFFEAKHRMGVRRFRNAWTEHNRDGRTHLVFSTRPRNRVRY